MIRRHAIATWAVAVVLVALTVVAPAAASLRHMRDDVRRYAVATHLVPVRACRTKTAANWQRGPRIPSARRVGIPARIAAQAALYIDAYSATAVLGPRGWRCVASYYADGGVLLFIYAPGERSPGFFPELWPPHRTNQRELVVQSNPACVSCVLAQACPYFASARHLLHEWGYWSSATTKACLVPHGERVAVLGTTLSSVVDPPGVLGNDMPSGGRYAALGEVGYVPVRRLGAGQASYLLTCTLPARDHALCYASLHWFARVNRTR